MKCGELGHGLEELPSTTLEVMLFVHMFVSILYLNITQSTVGHRIFNILKEF